MRESLLQGIIFSIANSEATSNPCLPVPISSYCPPIDVSGRAAGTVLRDKGCENFPLHILGLETPRFFRIMASSPAYRGRHLEGHLGQSGLAKWGWVRQLFIKVCPCVSSYQAENSWGTTSTMSGAWQIFIKYRFE